MIGPPPGPLFYELEDTRQWTVYDGSPDNGQGTMTARLQKMVSGVGGKTLHMWVHDSWYEPGKIDATELDTITDAFYDVAQPNTSIHPMATQIAGVEWGDHSYTNLILPSTIEIHIVLYDILENSPAWGIVGYFWSVNNYTDFYLEGMGLDSNEDLVFFMDAPIYLDTDRGGDKFFLRTLAHEFQHMIHFYQKFVRLGTASETWLDEMASMLIEDLLVYHILDYQGAGAGYGPATRNGDRLYYYTEFPDDSLIDWSGSQPDYASAFAFGGFLIRHYGADAGVTFTRNLVKSSFASLDAVNNALLLAGAGINADEALRRWGATMAIDPGKGTIPAGYGYPNKVIADYFGAGDLVLEAASMYSFQNPPTPPTHVPKRYSVPPGLIPSASNVVWEYQTGVTGNLSISLTLPSYTSLSVVVSPNL